MHRATPLSARPSRLRRTSDDAKRLLAAVHHLAVGHRNRNYEVFELARLIDHKLSHEVPGQGDEAQDDLDHRVSFVRHRFTIPLVAYENWDHWYGYIDNTLNILSILAGAASAVLAAIDTSKLAVVLLGAAVALLQSISQWIKPAQRSSRRAHAAARLRDEGWDFLGGQDRYTKGHGDLSITWPIFYAQVNRISQREDDEEQRESSHGAAPRSGGGEK